MSRQDEHEADVDAFPNKHIDTKSTEGGACLTGHVSGRDSKGRITQISCNYRWQAYKRAAGPDKGLYNYPRYKSACDGAAFFTQSRVGKKKANPSPGDWNVTGGSADNFQTACTVPYWHEAHHIVPHGELRDSIAAVGPGSQAAIYIAVIRLGLLEEKYNLNHKTNMIILPMDKRVAVAIKLPRHRHTPGHRSHKAYSKYIRGKLNEIFKAIRQDESAHKKKPPYKACKSQIVNISSTTRPEIIAAGGTVSLDEAFKPPAKSSL
jgi:hypothetical protein